jgi:hypothetical protein
MESVVNRQILFEHFAGKVRLCKNNPLKNGSKNRKTKNCSIYGCWSGKLNTLNITHL